MIKLNQVYNTSDGERTEAIYLPPEGIVVRPAIDFGSIIRFAGNHDSYYVTESSKEVVSKIMEYKLLNTKLSAFYNVHAIDPEDERAIIDQIRLIRISLDNLAGLDGDPDA